MDEVIKNPFPPNFCGAGHRQSFLQRVGAKSAQCNPCQTEDSRKQEKTISTHGQKDVNGTWLRFFGQGKRRKGRVS